MKKNLIILTTLLSVLPVLLVMISLTASAQTSNNYNLSAYKLPEIRYHQLETGLELSGRNNSDKRDDQKVLERYFNGRGSALYNSYLNSAKTQRYQSLNAYFSGRSEYQENSISKEKSSGYFPSVYYSIMNKRYFQNKLFIGTGASGRYFYGHNSNSAEYNDTLNMNSDITSKEQSLTLNVFLQFGIGRIEQVQDFQEAIYIYEDLLKSGRAVPGKSQQEVMELATLISQLNNKRFFDSRIKNIQDIETLDSFLIANNFKTLSDARYFATLVDNWNFVTHFVRESGTSIALAVNPEFNYYGERRMFELTDTRDKLLRETYVIEGGIVFEHHKPLNLYWQTNTSVMAMAGITNGINKSSSDTITYYDYKTSFPELNIYLNQSLEYYPNTRTRITASLNAGYNHYFEETIDSENIRTPGRQYLYSGLSLMVDYYITQKLRFNANSSVTYNYRNVDDMPAEKSNRFNADFGLRLAYSIF